MKEFTLFLEVLRAKSEDRRGTGGFWVRFLCPVYKGS